MRLADFRRQPMLRQCRLDPGDEIPTIGLVVGMLELAPPAFREVTARRFLVMRPRRERPVVEQRVAGHAKRNVAAAFSDAVAARGDTDDQLVHRAMAWGIASARSSAIIWAPAISAALP